MTPEDFRYIEHRIISVSAENFAPGKEREKGKSRSSVKITLAMPENGPAELIVLQLEIRVDGFVGEGRQDSDRSFTATMTCAHGFKAPEPCAIPDEEASKYLKLFVAQAYPVQLEKIKQLIHGMGFKGVNPDLGPRMKALPDQITAAGPTLTTEGAAKTAKPRRRKATN